MMDVKDFKHFSNFIFLSCVRGRQEKEIARRKFREAINDDILPKAYGMRYAIGIKDETRPTPRVIHALGKYTLEPFNIGTLTK